jgi:hypothetical protein
MAGAPKPPTYPDRSYQYMYKLIDQNRVQPLQDLFTDFLIMAICWEETMFRNIKQEHGGTGVGFGQTEPAEFSKLDGGPNRDKPDIDKKNPHYALAKKYNYNLPKLPDRNGPNLAGGSLSEEQSIQVISSMLCHGYYNNGQSRQAALYTYAGVYSSRKVAQKLAKGEITAEKAKKMDPLGEAARIQIVRGWEKCEAELTKIENQYTADKTIDRRPLILQALYNARTYPMSDPQYALRLFPEGDSVWNPKKLAA